MKKLIGFIKDNSYDVLKLYINQLGIAIFSFILYFAVNSIKKDGDADSANLYKWVMLAVSIFSTLFYFVLLYTATWDLGAKDRIRVDSGRMKRMIAKGTVLGSLASVLNFILIFLSLTGALLQSNEFFKLIYGLSAPLLAFTASMYTGIVQAVFPRAEAGLYTAPQIALILVLVILSIGVIQLGYSLGMREKKIFNFKSSNKKKD